MPENVLEFTSMIVSSFLGKNQTSRTDLPALIRTVHAALTDAAAPSPGPAPPQTPAVTVRRSITPDAILCMECGKPFKSLKRHLSTDHALSPDAYRAKWSLPKTYPMVAPAYSAARSVLAKSIGLGARGRVAAGETTTADPIATPAAPEVVEAPAALEPKAFARAAARAKAATAKPKRPRAVKAKEAE
jgi:predicted transcriptional regulator